MKQILQNFKTGELQVADVPIPAIKAGRVRVRTVASLISSGTERMSLQLAKKNLLGKALERPDLVKQVIQKVKSEGLANTANVVRARLDGSKPLGYSASGIVMDVADDVTGFRKGDRVACAGGGYASHAEVISVPQNLCVHLPDSVSFEAGAFGTLGAIALHGIRLTEPTIGESFVVIGLGLLGQLTVQLLRIAGCRVFGVDPDANRTKLAIDLGANAAATLSDEIGRKIIEWTKGRGADAVIITAASSSNEPIRLAGEISRLKGRVVAVGLVGMEVPRETFYERELTLKISMAYGPGRYDSEYEERGHDYPFAYVRWTENRNIEAFLDLVSEDKIKWAPLISHRFSIRNADEAYRLISGESGEPHLGVILNYESEGELPALVNFETRGVTRKSAADQIRVGVIGAGNYVSSRLLPHFKAEGVEFHSLTTLTGVSAQNVGQKFGFKQAISNADEIIEDPQINLIVIGTRHDLHAELAQRALNNGKHVFVEKPLALNTDQLAAVISAAEKSDGELMVGFNRRFSPLAYEAKQFFADRNTPLSILYRINAGRVSPNHWIQDPVEGGGRIIGEVCHFIDLMQFWTGALVKSVFAEPVESTNVQVIATDSVFITLRFADGSNGCIAYLAEGDKRLAKERIEIFGGEKTFVLDDFCSAVFHNNGRHKRKSLRSQNKGQQEEVRLVCDVVRGKRKAPISLEELRTTTLSTFQILKSIRTGEPQQINE